MAKSVSDAEIHTLETIRTRNSMAESGDEPDAGADLHAGADADADADADPNSSTSCVLVSDTEEALPVSAAPAAAAAAVVTSVTAAGQSLGGVAPPQAAAASVSHEQAHAGVSLETACQEGDVALVERLLTPANLNNGGLHYAAAHNQWRVCQLLVARGADVNCRISPLNATPLLWAARSGHVYIVKLLLDNGADARVADSSGFTLLHLAVHSSNVLMVAYAVHLELDVDRPDVGNRTPLHWAIVQGDQLSVEVLLKSGASSNLADGEGALPLQLAVHSAQSEYIVALLLQHGADPQGQAIDLASAPKAWASGCRLAGRQSNGLPLKSRLLSPEIAKVVTSATPLVVVPAALSLPAALDSALLGVPLALLLAWLAKRWLSSHVIPYCWTGDKAVLQSTLLAGLFVAIFTSAATFWATRVLGAVLPEWPWTSMLVLVLIGVVAVSYTGSMLMDPGKIEPRSLAARLTGMNDLLERGLFDSVHLCIHTFVVIPARAQYDYYLERVICRYDHYCPWLYNAVGVRNHRLFVVFLLAVAVIVPTAGAQYYSYAQTHGSSSFANGACALILLQAVWVYALTAVQLSQLARGATSFEVTHASQLALFRTDPLKAYSSLPRDHPRAPEILGTAGSSAFSLRKHAGSDAGPSCRQKAPLWMRLTGFSQVAGAWRLLRHRVNVNRTDFGVAQNCADFWCAGGSPLRPDGTAAALGGKPVDYSRLVQIPSHPVSESDRILP